MILARIDISKNELDDDIEFITNPTYGFFPKYNKENPTYLSGKKDRQEIVDFLLKKFGYFIAYYCLHKVILAIKY